MSDPFDQSGSWAQCHGTAVVAEGATYITVELECNSPAQCERLLRLLKKSEWEGYGIDFKLIEYDCGAPNAPEGRRRRKAKQQ